MIQPLKKANVKGKTVLVRTDFNVPLQDLGDRFEVKDDFRIRKALPTLQHLSARKAKVIVVSHLGRPKGWDEKLSLQPTVECLAELLKYKFVVIDQRFHRLPRYTLPHVFFFKADFTHKSVDKLLPSMKAGDIAVLENIRFYEGEGEDDPSFAQALAELADVYINDAFAVSHRTQATITRLPGLLPHYAGLGLEREVSALSRIARKPDRPLVLLVGGIKLGDKLNGLSGLLARADHALVGGGLAALFFSVQGYKIGKSIVDEKFGQDAREILRNYKEKIILPTDVIVARSPEEPETIRVTLPYEVGPAEMILDIGPATIRLFSEYIKKGRTLVWAGPMGMFEVKEFSHGTRSLGRLFASRSHGLAYGVAGGGNTLEAIHMIKMEEYFDFLSTGGTAMLEFLSGRELPGLEALSN